MKYTLAKEIILIQGDTISELDLDFDKLSLSDIKAANKVKDFFTDSSMNVDSTSLSPRLDPNLRIGLAWVAAMRSDRRISINDVLSLSAKDALILSEEALEYFF